MMNRRDLLKSVGGGAVAAAVGAHVRHAYATFGMLAGSPGSAALQDLSWSATVTGSAKSAAAGYIAPVAFNGSAYNGASGEQGGRIYPVGSAQTVDVYFERILGETGSISTTVSTFASLNTVAGTHFTSVSQTLTWADGQIGWQKVSIPILAIPSSFGLVGITCSGSYAYRPTSWIWLQGGARDANAKYLITSNGVNVSGNTSGSGTLASPWQSLQYAVGQMGTSGGILYVQANGVHTEWSGTAGSGSGPQISNVCSNTAPLVIMPDPNNTSVVEFDQGSTAGGTAILYSNANGPTFASTATSVWLCGFHCYRGNVSFYGSTQCVDCVVWQCDIDNFSSSGDDAGGLRADNSKYFIGQDLHIHEHYSTQAGTSNSYTSVAAELIEGFQSFYAVGPSLAHCNIGIVQYAVMEKQASNTTTDFSVDVTHCLGYKLEQGTGGGGNFVCLPVQGAAYNNAIIRYSVYDGSNDLAIAGGLVYAPGSTAQSGYVDIVNCVVIASGTLGGGGGGSITNLTNTDHFRIFNCISQDSSYDEIIVAAPSSGLASQLEYSNWNMYVNGSKTWAIGYGGTETTYNPLSNWQTAASGTYLEYSSQDINSTATTTTPSYANLSANNYRINNSGGRGNRPIGVGAEGVGIANNFLNSALPVTA